MDREIKFKVFHKGSITERIKIDGYERINGNRWEWMSLEMNPDKGERWSRGVYSWSDKYIRAQFTGLKDKDGKEIYEGDILKHPDGDKGFVRFDYGWAIQYSDTYSHDMPKYYCDNLEIIGNIFENPDLTKKEVSNEKS